MSCTFWNMRRRLRAKQQAEQAAIAKAVEEKAVVTDEPKPIRKPRAKSAE